MKIWCCIEKSGTLVRTKKKPTWYVKDHQTEACIARATIPSPSESPLQRYFRKAGVGPETNELQEKKDFQ